MQGPINILRSDRIEGLTTLGSLLKWKEGNSYLFLDQVIYKGTQGVILVYHNPPVHQVGNPGLDAYLNAIEIMSKRKSEFKFLVLYGANDPVHAGGDIKESLLQMDVTLAKKRELAAKGASSDEIDQLYGWGDRRLEKGIAIYRGIRRLAQEMRVVAVCGGGTRYGGSAEIVLIADVIVGDSRSGMCFSEAMIGLIPGWCGIGRTITKAGLFNAAYMAQTANEVKASQLKAMGVYNEIVDILIAFPKKESTGDPERDDRVYQEALQKHNDDTGLLLLPKTLELAVCSENDIPKVRDDERLLLGTGEFLSREVKRRSDPSIYEGLWGKPLKEIKEKIAALGRPLAPQSIQTLDELFARVEMSSFDEDTFVEAEMKADSRLYRDPRFRAGIIATLEQKVADFREVRDK